jgi:hypothetical protein
LVLTSKRRRTKVDYALLNQEMFGDVECYDGEGGSDGEWGPNSNNSPRQRTPSGRATGSRGRGGRRRS